MLCTNCSHLIRPVVAVDLDGTLGDYHGHFEDFAMDWLGIGWVTNSYTGDIRYREWFCDAYGVDETTFRLIKLAYRQGGMKRTMPAHREAGWVMRSLAKQAEVWVTTTRPWARYDRVDPDTVEWLRRNRISHDGLLFDEHKIDELYERIDPSRVVAVLDDEPRVLEDVVAGVPILLRTQYNGQAEWDGTQASSLPGAKIIIDQLLHDWNEEHE